MHKVYITDKIQDGAGSLLEARGFSVDSNRSGKKLSASKLAEIFASYDAVISTVGDKIDDEILKSPKNSVKIVANFAVGFDNIDVLSAKRHNIVVCNTPGVAQEAVAEHAFALILACSKKLLEADKFVRLNEFHGFDPMIFNSGQIRGKTLGIVGLGKIGTLLGQIAFGGFRMKILYTDVVRASDFELLCEAKYCQLETLLKESDIISLHVPLTIQTHHLITKEQFKLMKNSAILINTARGGVVDENALVWALKEGEIAYAGLDVFENEQEVSCELRDLKNVILTPHIASATFECREEMAKIAAQNIIAFFAGKTPIGIIKVK